MEENRMEKVLKWIYGLMFLLLCIAVFWFLHLFTVTKQEIIYIDWQTSMQILENGEEKPFIIDEYSTNSEQKGTYRFTASLPENLGNGSLLFETNGLQLTLSLNGEEIYQSSAILPSSIYSMSSAQIPLNDEVSGELIMTCKILDNTNVIFPPMLRFIPEGYNDTQSMSYANLYGIPAGFSAMALLLVFGLFILSVLRKQIEWSLLPLSIALVGLCAYRLIQSCGYYFLPQEAVSFFGRAEFSWLSPCALMIYIAMNHRRNFWTFLGKAAICSSIVLIVAYFFSAMTGGYLADYLNGAIKGLLTYGYYDGLLYWLTLWLAIICAMISAYWLMQSIAQQHAHTQMLTLKNQLIMNDYHNMESKIRQTASIRHEMRHQLTVLEALIHQKDYEGLDTLLESLKQQTSNQIQTVFSDNITVNIILQDAAARAMEQKTLFDAHAHLPKELPISDNDLCTLLMNMLDNALEATNHLGESQKRFIYFKAEYKNGFLAIKCENSFDHQINEGENGLPQTTKSDTHFHGFGLTQMSAIAEKYHSMLDISYTNNGVFTIQTALQLPKH